MKRMTRRTTTVSPETRAALLRQAQAEGKSESSMGRQWMEDYLKGGLIREPDPPAARPSVQVVADVDFITKVNAKLAEDGVTLSEVFKQRAELVE